MCNMSIENYKINITFLVITTNIKTSLANGILLLGQIKYECGFKQRTEIELVVSDGHNMELLLMELGFSIILNYVKTRDI